MMVRDKATSRSYSTTAHTLPTQEMKRLGEQYKDVLSRLQAQEAKEAQEAQVARAKEALAREQAAEAARNVNRQKRSAMMASVGTGGLQSGSAKKQAIAVMGEESECGLCVPG